MSISLQRPRSCHLQASATRAPEAEARPHMGPPTPSGSEPEAKSEGDSEKDEKSNFHRGRDYDITTRDITLHEFPTVVDFNKWSQRARANTAFICKTKQGL